MRTPLVLLLLPVILAACTAPAQDATPMADPSEPALKDVFADAFLVGGALNERQFSGRDARGLPLITKHFNTATAENVMKWEHIHPEPGRYAFEPADRFVDFAEEHDMFVVGHTLVWHSQTPDWVFEDENGEPLTREALLARMEDHITTVVGRYKGRVHGWDVVNEALNEDGTLRDSPWRRIIGDDYIEHAFRFAHAADPEAELYYNDYSLENAPKRNGAVRLVQRLLDAGVPVTGIGTQAHVNLVWPTLAQMDSTIRAFAELGDVMITELEVDVLPSRDGSQTADVSARQQGGDELNPYTEGLPEDVQQRLAERYAELFRVFLDHRDAITRVTFWGVTDGDSWKNDFPVPGRTNHPLLFDRTGAPKPAFEAVVQTARTASSD